MYKLVETKLQKVILLIGGLLVFFRLLDVSYYDRYGAIFTSIGISVLVIVLLIILRDYSPKFHLKIIAVIKRHKRILIILSIVLVLAIVGWILYTLNTEEKEAPRKGGKPLEQLLEEMGLPPLPGRELPELPELPGLPPLR